MQGEMKAMQAEIKSMQKHLRASDGKIDTNTDFLAGKIQHHVSVLREKSMRDRTRFEEERYIRIFRQREIEQRLEDVEARLARLEAPSS